MLKPYISKTGIRQALNNMLLGISSEEPEGFQHLATVDLFLSDPDLPRADHIRQYALNAVLSNLIEDELRAHRRSFGLDSPEPTAPRVEACQQLALDAQQRASDLLGWSLLYYRYVRVDLNITPAEASTLTHMDNRTLRRYQAHAIDLLRDALIAAEWSARREMRQIQLNAQIPAVIPARLYGREALLREVTGPNAPRHMLVTGTSGIGKTSFLGTILREYIANDTLDQVVWVDAPESLPQLRKYVQQETSGDSTLNLRQWSRLYKVAVVLDNIDALLNEQDALRGLLADMAEAQVYLSSRFYTELSPDIAHIALGSLDRDAAAALVQSLRGTYDDADSRAFADVLFDRVGGNPRIIKLAANSIVNLNLGAPLINDEMVTNLFFETYAALSDASKTLLMMLAILPPTRLNRAEIAARWSNFQPGDSQILELLSCSMIDNGFDGNLFTLDSAARGYIQALYHHNGGIHQQIDRLVEEINLQGLASLAVVEHLLLADWLELSTARRHSLLETHAGRGLKAAHYAVWAKLLAEEDLSFDLHINRAVCLRALGDYGNASDILETVIERAGQSGDFGPQARALVELSAICRHQGRYDEALRRLSQTSSARDQVLINRIKTEQAQIAVDQGDMTRAYTILEDQPRSLQNLQLLSEVTAATGSLLQSQRFLDMALLQAEQPREIGRLRAALARVQAQQQDYSKAEDSFASAMALLEQEQDAFALARCQANLAAMLIQTKEDLSYAEQLLTQAERQQTIMQDRVGLMFTRHNLHALDQILAIDAD